MNKVKQTADEAKILRVGYVVPGWPLKHFPNGIVTYVQNILLGLDAITKPILFASALVGDEADDKLVALNKINNNHQLLQRLIVAVLYRLNFGLAKKTLYKLMMMDNALKLHLAIQALKVPLDILEIDESFGTASQLVKMNTVPIVTRIHGPWLMMPPITKANANWDYQYRVFYEGQAIANAHGVTAPSLDVLQKVRQFYGLSLPNARVIPNPVPTVAIDKQWVLNLDKPPTILFVGRFDLLKGGDLILDAFRQIALSHPTIELLFVGPDGGINVDGKTLRFNAYIERFIPESSIKQRIQFFGHCDSLAIAELRRQSLITVVCSRYEAFSLSLVEALATGCPTVATAVGGMKEIIINEYNGLLAEPESVASIVGKILELISDPEKMQTLSKNAIEDCKKRFAPEAVAAQTVAYYKTILSAQAAVQ